MQVILSLLLVSVVILVSAYNFILGLFKSLKDPRYLGATIFDGMTLLAFIFILIAII